MEKLENVYGAAKLVAQLFIHGDSNEDSLVAVVVPDIETLPSFLKTTHDDAIDTENMSLSQLCDRYAQYIKDSILQEFRELAFQAGLHGFEIIKNVYIEREPWTNTGDSAILTPTMKLKRSQAKARYASQIKLMYGELRGAKENTALEVPRRSKL